MKKLLLALLVLGGASAYGMSESREEGFFVTSPLTSAVQLNDVQKVRDLVRTATLSDVKNALAEAEWRYETFKNNPSAQDIAEGSRTIITILKTVQE